MHIATGWIYVVPLLTLWSFPLLAAPADANSTLPDVLKEGLVLHYSFDAGAGDTVRDDSGRGHDGALKGATREKQGKRGGAMRFKGKAEIITPHAANLAFSRQDSFTIALWARHDGDFGSWQGVVCKSRGTPPFVGLYIEPGGKWVVYTGPLKGPRAKKTWEHVAVVQDGESGSRTLYIDGEPVDTGEAQDANGPGILAVGSGGCGYAYFPGLLDDVCIYNRALSRDAVTQLKAATAGGAER